MFLGRILKVAKSMIRRSYVFLDRIDKVLERKKDTRIHTYLVRRAAAGYDMTEAVDELYYATRYGDFISAELAKLEIQGGHLVDLACGQGRLILELRRRGLNFSQITGVDFSSEVLEKCRQNLDEALPGNSVVLKNNDVHRFVGEMEDNSADVILILEVLYMVFEPEKIYQQLSQKLRPGGVAFLSVRSDLFYALTLLKQGLYEKTEEIFSKKMGDILGSGVTLNWTNSEQILHDFPKQYGLKVSAITGIGSCSGIPGDPHDQICRPSQFGEREQKYLSQLEKKVGDSYPDTGRYILFSVNKEIRSKAKL
jgi:2-polyprenyl-3-methyl-5-hydroxy-6-metoxy-1,4-benzoquinol methylase